MALRAIGQAGTLAAMYNPAHFALDDQQAYEVAEQIAVAHVITNTTAGLYASFIPLLLSTNESGHVLQGHIAKANTHWQHHTDSTEVLAIFSGPSAYVSPRLYPSKQEHGKVVPTWNYVIVEARGTLAFHHDVEWKRSLVTRLTDRHESNFPTQLPDDAGEVWKVTDAPPTFIDAQLNGIVGVEIVVTHIAGKAKLSQNRTEADRSSVLRNYENRSDTTAVANAMRTY